MNGNSDHIYFQERHIKFFRAALEEIKLNAVKDKFGALYDITCLL